jgi:hypothetical protein
MNDLRSQYHLRPESQALRRRTPTTHKDVASHLHHARPRSHRSHAFEPSRAAYPPNGSFSPAAILPSRWVGHQPSPPASDALDALPLAQDSTTASGPPSFLTRPALHFLNHPHRTATGAKNALTHAHTQPDSLASGVKVQKPGPGFTRGMICAPNTALTTLPRFLPRGGDIRWLYRFPWNPPKSATAQLRLGIR